MNISKFCLLFCLLIYCSSEQKNEVKKKKSVKVAILPFQNKKNAKESSLGRVLRSSIISSINFLDSHRYVDKEFENYYIYNAMQLAQSIGDEQFEKFLKDIIVINKNENPGIDLYISGFYFRKNNIDYVQIKFYRLNGEETEFRIEAKQDSIELYRKLSQKILLNLEPGNLEAIEKSDIEFKLTNNFEAFRFFLEGKEEKRKKTIHGYMNAVRKFRDSQRKDGLYILPLNETIHTIAQISNDLLELKKQEKILNNRNILADANAQLKRNAEIIKKGIERYTQAKHSNPGESEKIQILYENSAYKNQYEFKSSLFKNQLEMLMIKWEDEKFETNSIIKGQIKGINSAYTPLLVTEFFQTLTGSKININDILRAILKYSKEHPENRYYIHYFKNFTRLIKTLNEFNFMQLNPEANFSYHQLHQEYIFYVREYLKVMREGL